MNAMYDVRGIANWFLDKASECNVDLSNMALNKIVYFAVENAIISDGVLLTNAKIEAWEHGPVFREIYHEFKSFEKRSIRSRAKKFDVQTRSMVEAKEVFSMNVINILNKTFEDYGYLTASQLRAISHQPGGAWDTVWWHEGRINPGMEITKENIKISLNRSASSNG